MMPLTGLHPAPLSRSRSCSNWLGMSRSEEARALNFPCPQNEQRQMMPHRIIRKQLTAVQA